MHKLQLYIKLKLLIQNFDLLYRPLETIQHCSVLLLHSASQWYYISLNCSVFFTNFISYHNNYYTQPGILVIILVKISSIMINAFMKNNCLKFVYYFPTFVKFTSLVEQSNHFLLFCLYVGINMNRPSSIYFLL